MQYLFFGIDFGTFTTTISHIKNAASFEPEIIRIDNSKIVETVLRVTADGQQVELIGSDAWANAYEAPGRTFFEFKPNIASGEKYPMDGQNLTAEGIGKLFLSYVRKRIEQTVFNKETLTEIAKVRKITTVIGYPAEWDEVQKKATVQMASGAGFPNVSGCDEPLGAIYYHYYQGDIDLEKEQYVLVHDFGGCSTGTSIVEIRPGAEPHVHAVSVVKDAGGRKYDERITADVTDGICKQTGSETLPLEDILLIRRHCRQIKESLSLNIENRVESAQETIPRLKTKNFEHVMTLTKDNFEKMHSDLLNDFAEPIRDVLDKASIHAKKINMVISTGGSSRFYFVPEKLREIFPDAIFLRSTHPQECVSKGLSLYVKMRACGLECLKPENKSKPVRIAQETLKQRKTGMGKKSLHQNTETNADGTGHIKSGMDTYPKKPAKQKKPGMGKIILESIKWTILTALLLLFVFVVLGVFWK